MSPGRVLRHIRAGVPFTDSGLKPGRRYIAFCRTISGAKTETRVGQGSHSANQRVQRATRSYADSTDPSFDFLHYVDNGGSGIGFTSLAGLKRSGFVM